MQYSHRGKYKKYRKYPILHLIECSDFTLISGPAAACRKRPRSQRSTHQPACTQLRRSVPHAYGTWACPQNAHVRRASSYAGVGVGALYPEDPSREHICPWHVAACRKRPHSKRFTRRPCCTQLHLTASPPRPSRRFCRTGLRGRSSNEQLGSAISIDQLLN